MLTYAALKLSGLPSQRVIGSGTVLDTARFRYLLSQHFRVDARSVHAFIIGEHGDSEVPVWSLANIAGMKLEDFCRAQGMELNAAMRQNIYQQTRDAAYQIIQRKGATYYAVAAGLIGITAAILRDQNSVFSVSTLIHDYYRDRRRLPQPSRSFESRGSRSRSAPGVECGGNSGTAALSRSFAQTAKRLKL